MNDAKFDKLRPHGINGIEINLHVEFHNVVEEIIESAMQSPHFDAIGDEDIAQLVFDAIKSYKLDRRNIDGYVVAMREKAAGSK